MNKRQASKAIDAALKRVQAEIHDMAQQGDSLYGKGLATEGFSGGYAQALMDVSLVLNSGCMPNSRDYWIDMGSVK